MTITIDIDQIVNPRDAGVAAWRQAQRALDHQHAETLTRATTPLPPIVVTALQNDAKYLLIDGQHRIAAALLLGEATIVAVLASFAHQSDVTEAIYRANMQHGKPMTNGERMNYARFLVSIYPDLSTRQIAAKAGVAHSTIANLRNPAYAGAAMIQEALRTFTKAQIQAAAPVAEVAPARPAPGRVAGLALFFAEHACENKRKVIYYVSDMTGGSL